MSDLIITGRLEYLGWQRPWTVQTEAGPVDISANFWRVAQALESQPTTMEYERDAILIRRDENSDMILKHGGVGEGVYITKPEGFGFSNIAAYLEWALCVLNARQITAMIAPDADAFSLHVAAGEDVPGVQYTGRGNMCRVPEGMEREVCGLGQGKGACIFLTLGAGTGFQCAKFEGPVGRSLLERHATGQMNAGRIGNCRCVGREADQP